jgi:hypothetical protein
MSWLGSAPISLSVQSAAVPPPQVPCTLQRRGRRPWKIVPLAMLAGGVWGALPDFPRTLRQQLDGTLVADIFGSHALEDFLHAHGDWFFIHGWLDHHYGTPWHQPRGLGLVGIALLVAAYNVLVGGLFVALDRQKEKATTLKAVVARLRLAQVEADNTTHLEAQVANSVEDMLALERLLEQVGRADAPRGPTRHARRRQTAARGGKPRVLKGASPPAQARQPSFFRNSNKQSRVCPPAREQAGPSPAPAAVCYQPPTSCFPGMIFTLRSC